MAFFSLNQLPLYTDDFFFYHLNNPSIRDAIVVHNPPNALITSPVFLRSTKSLGEHIQYICNNNVKKAIIVAEDIHFLNQCPSLEYVKILPAVAAENFDFSPLYELPNLKWLDTITMYGVSEEKASTINYSFVPQIKHLFVSGSKGHMNINSLTSLETLICDSGFPNCRDLTGVINSAVLTDLKINQSALVSLDGIASASHLQKLSLSYNRKLSDISELAKLGESLQELEIDACNKIFDFSILAELRNLERLTLKGKNTLPNLSFIQNMHKLKFLRLTMNVTDDDFSVCKNIPEVWIKIGKNKKITQ